MNNKQEIVRKLTREEQLKWYVEFLESEIEKYKLELERAKKELEQEQTLKLKNSH